MCAWAGEESRIQNQSSGMRRRGRQNAKTRLRKTWLPSLRRVTLRGILLSEAYCCQRHIAVRGILLSEWVAASRMLASTQEIFRIVWTTQSRVYIYMYTYIAADLHILLPLLQAVSDLTLLSTRPSEGQQPGLWVPGLWPGSCNLRLYE